MNRVAVVAAFLLAQSVSAQENLQTQDQVAQALGSQGFVPFSLLEDGLESCQAMMGSGSSVSERRLSLEYCGTMLVNTIRNAMKFRVGDVQLSLESDVTTPSLEEIRERLASAIASQLATEAALEEEMSRAYEAKRRADLLSQQVAALRRQLSSLQASLDAAEADKATVRAQLEALGEELNAARARLALQELELR